VTRRAISVTNLARTAGKAPAGIERGRASSGLPLCSVNRAARALSPAHIARNGLILPDTGTPVAAGLARSIDCDHRQQPNSWCSCGVVVTTTVGVTAAASSGPRCQAGGRPTAPGGHVSVPTAGAGRLQASRLCRARKASSLDSAADPCRQDFSPEPESHPSAIAPRRGA
jgi:hypothetical protein